MCRIAGIASRSVPVSSLKETVQTMCQIQRHGGPDDEGIYASEAHRIVLGHRRLSLIDLSPLGHQPMSYDAGRYQISFNGEIYNYLELKAELKDAGYIFNTGSDTEVILAGFAAWGAQSFSRLNGMFAFALLDTTSSDLYLVRDVAGIKPLYYGITKDGIAFASEIRGFKPIPQLQETNEYWKVYLMAYGHVPEPVTTLQHVKPLEKGSYLKYHLPTGNMVIERFAQFSYVERIRNRQEAIGLVKDSLQKAVTRHLISDAPIGVFLSGGLDSSIIALLANSGSKLNTLSLYFDDVRYSEKKYQDILQESLFCQQYQYLLKKEEFDTYLPSILNAMDLPSCDGINTWFISKVAKDNGLKAVLSGIGGDELFGGYPSFSRMKLAMLLEKFPNSVLRTAKYTGLKKIRRLSYLSLGGVIGKYLFLRGQFVPNEIAQQLDADESEVWRILSEEPRLDNIDHLTPHNQASWIEMNLYMQNQLLRDADVMSMAHGIEIRVPFLDKEFITLALQIRSAAKYAGPKGKQLLIDSFKDILPEPIWNRPKMGFSFPFKEWLTDNDYAKNRGGRNHDKNYTKFASGGMHWSQFLTLLLIENHTNA